VPPNVSFEIDDCTKTWTWDADCFDFVHIRYLFGAIRDWTALFKQAYRTLKPGTYVESVESEPTPYSDDGSVADDGKTALGGRFGAIFREAGKVTGNSMSVITDNIQVQAMKDAGFVDVQEITHKVGEPPSPAFNTMLTAAGPHGQLAEGLQALPDRRLCQDEPRI
jgi:hypothetical protein